MSSREKHESRNVSPGLDNAPGYGQLHRACFPCKFHVETKKPQAEKLSQESKAFQVTNGTKVSESMIPMSICPCHVKPTKAHAEKLPDVYEDGSTRGGTYLKQQQSTVVKRSLPKVPNLDSS